MTTVIICASDIVPAHSKPLLLFFFDYPDFRFVELSPLLRSFLRPVFVCKVVQQTQALPDVTCDNLIPTYTLQTQSAKRHSGDAESLLGVFLSEPSSRWVFPAHAQSKGFGWQEAYVNGRNYSWHSGLWADDSSAKTINTTVQRYRPWPLTR